MRGRPLGRHGAQFAGIANHANCIYLCELSNGLVKVGFSNAPKRRLVALSRLFEQAGVSIDRFAVFNCGPSEFRFLRDPVGAEKRAIKGLEAIANAAKGREYFPISYDTALPVVANAAFGA